MERLLFAIVIILLAILVTLLGWWAGIGIILLVILGIIAILAALFFGLLGAGSILRSILKKSPSKDREKDKEERRGNLEKTKVTTDTVDKLPNTNNSTAVSSFIVLGAVIVAALIIWSGSESKPTDTIQLPSSSETDFNKGGTPMDLQVHFERCNKC